MLRLELVNISKQYPAVKANDSVNLRVKPGDSVRASYTRLGSVSARFVP